MARVNREVAVSIEVASSTHANALVRGPNARLPLGFARECRRVRVETHTSNDDLTAVVERQAALRKAWKEVMGCRLGGGFLAREGSGSGARNG